MQHYVLLQVQTCNLTCLLANPHPMNNPVKYHPTSATIKELQSILEYIFTSVKVIARGRAILVRWSPCWSLIMRVSQSRRAGFGRAAEEQRENDGKAEDDGWKRTMTMERRKTTNENDKGLMIGRNSSVIYISDSFLLVHSFIKGGSSLSFSCPWNV